ncbi:hypothetical protein SAMN05445756_0549 [Kytococcus aerolatus]|uniref:Sulfotransferase family protein n=1 Tax=Kytococcus aerolatus TaxID=592308 RepID=A0A212T6W5_9MICO|nr:hypothetical protein SAMN05445756_0549 [Kytococcus aerolatus]
MVDHSEVGSPSYPRTIYVTGAARSGSTLIGEVIGTQPGVLTIGEISLFWRDVARGNRCACGEVLTDCPLWSYALQEVCARIGISSADYGDLAATRARLARTTRPTELLRLRRTPAHAWPDDVRLLVAATTWLVAAAAEKAGADVVVDTSKTTPGALFLDLCGAEYSLLHVMRRPEAVVSSTLRSRGVERGNAESAPPGGSLAVGVARWVWANLNAVLVLKISRARSAVRWDYERFVENAEQMTLELVASLGIPPDSSPFVGRTVELGESHSAVGNPGRGGERITLREDHRWRSELSATDQRLIQTMTWPVVSWLGGQVR